MPTLSCLVVLPCTLELLIVCKRKLLPLPHPKLKSLHHQKENTPYGLEDLSWLLYLPSNRCGLASKNMMNPAHQLSTESASKLVLECTFHLLRIWHLMNQL